MKFHVAVIVIQIVMLEFCTSSYYISIHDIIFYLFFDSTLFHFHLFVLSHFQIQYSSFHYIISTSLTSLFFYSTCSFSTIFPSSSYSSSFSFSSFLSSPTPPPTPSSSPPPSLSPPPPPILLLLLFLLPLPLLFPSLPLDLLPSLIFFTLSVQHSPTS